MLATAKVFLATLNSLVYRFFCWQVGCCVVSYHDFFLPRHTLHLGTSLLRLSLFPIQVRYNRIQRTI